MKYQVHKSQLVTLVIDFETIFYRILPEARENHADDLEYYMQLEFGDNMDYYLKEVLNIDSTNYWEMDPENQDESFMDMLYNDWCDYVTKECKTLQLKH